MSSRGAQSTELVWILDFKQILLLLLRRNGVTQIFRSFHHRRLESLDHFNVFIYIYIYHSEHYGLIFGPTDAILVYKVSSFSFCVYVSIFFLNYTLHVCCVFKTDSFDDRRSQCRLI